MPLNIQDSEDNTIPAPGKPERPPTPIPPHETEKAWSLKNILLWVFLVVALVSAFFLLFQFGIIPGDGERDATVAVPVDAVAVPIDPAASASPEPTPAPPGAMAGEAKPSSGDQRERLTSVEGEYTIFISAFHQAADAEELAGRWEKAGYPAFVQHTSGWYRVGLGRYGTVVNARQEAERLRQAFEEGYYIGRVEL